MYNRTNEISNQDMMILTRLMMGSHPVSWLSDNDLANRLASEVAVNMEISSEEYALVMEAASRLSQYLASSQGTEIEDTK